MAILTGSSTWNTFGVRWKDDECVEFFMVNFVSPMFEELNMNLDEEILKSILNSGGRVD
jgi:hypothetical protein